MTHLRHWEKCAFCMLTLKNCLETYVTSPRSYALETACICSYCFLFFTAIFAIELCHTFTRAQTCRRRARAICVRRPSACPDGCHHSLLCRTLRSGSLIAVIVHHCSPDLNRESVTFLTRVSMRSVGTRKHMVGSLSQMTPDSPVRTAALTCFHYSNRTVQ